jgi:hypothetical protein
VVALSACKAADGAASDTQCQSWCAHEASAITAIAKDIEAAERAAGELDSDACPREAGRRRANRFIASIFLCYWSPRAGVSPVKRELESQHAKD